jgi:hypothetical protein
LELQKNEPKSLKSLSRAQNRTPDSSALASVAGRRVRTPVKAGLFRISPEGVDHVVAELSANKPRSG